MAADEPSGARPGPVVLRIKLRYDDVDAMVQKFAPNVGKSGLFLPTKSVQPIGAEVKFELRLANDTPVLVGLGRVKAAREPDPANPRAAFGIAVELMRVTPTSRDLILRMLERRRQLGLPETALPLPADVDAARRDSVAEIKDIATGPVAVVTEVKDIASGPVASLGDAGESVPVLTAPRQPTGPIAVAVSAPVAPLDPEPARRKRTPVAELIASASGPVAAVAVPGLDDDVDVSSVLARARALAGGDLDGELDALRESAAAPLEISVEAASAELARQLGGAAIATRDRSARWAPPPPAIIAPPVETPPEDYPEPEAPQAAATEVDEAPEPALLVPSAVEQVTTDPVAEALDRELIHDGADPAAFGGEPDELEVEADQIADEIHQLDDDEIEEVEHTQIGAMPTPIDEEAVAQRVDAELDAAEAEADEDLDLANAIATYDRELAEIPSVDPVDIDELPDAEEPPYQEPPYEQPQANAADAYAADGYAAEPYAPAPYAPEAYAPETYAPEAYAEEPAQTYAPEAYAEEPAQAYAAEAYAAEAYAPEPVDDRAASVDLDEIDDFEILAEADADEDIEPVVADVAPVAPIRDRNGTQELPPERQSFSFVQRLDLGDDSDFNEPAPEAEFYEARPDDFAHEPGPLDPRVLSAGYALAQFQDSDDNSLDAIEPVGESSYTYANDIPRPDSVPGLPFDHYQSRRTPAHQFDDSDVLVALPQARPADEVDLESALEALDVDLDDLSVSQPVPTPGGGHSRELSGRAPTKPVSGRTMPRATTEDGLEIEFDDDDEL